MVKKAELGCVDKFLLISLNSTFFGKLFQKVTFETAKRLNQFFKNAFHLTAGSVVSRCHQRIPFATWNHFDFRGGEERQWRMLTQAPESEAERKLQQKLRERFCLGS